MHKKFKLWLTTILLLSLLPIENIKLNTAYAETSLVTQAAIANRTTRNNGKKMPYLKSCKGISSANTRRKIVALTFDDGPNKIYTEAILDILRAYNIKATFFVVGKNISEYPDIVRLAYAEGHVIGNHTYSHHHLDRLTGEAIENELTKASNALHNVIGIYPRLFRPPYGACNAKSVRVARNLGLKTIMWSAVTEDYYIDRTTPEKIASEIIAAIHPGAIICLHDGGGNRAKTVAALQIIITTLISYDYKFLTIPELLNIEPYFT